MYTVVSNLSSVIVIRHLLNVSARCHMNLLALNSLRLPSLELSDNQNLEMILVLLSDWKIILKFDVCERGL